MDITERALTVPRQARSLRIVDDASYLQAGEMLTGIRSLRKEIDAAFDPIISRANAALKEAVAQKKRADAPLVEAEGILKPGILAYETEQERLRQAEERRLQELARKQAEEEHLRAALEAEARGDKEEAAAIMAEPIAPAPVVVARTVPKLAGISGRDNWTFRIVDEAAIPREYLTPDTAKLGRYARAMKQSGRIPGVEIYNDRGIAVRTK